MGERPILFSGPMVRAILSGAKTQTRRVVAGSPRQTWLTGAALSQVQRFVPSADNWWTMAVGEARKIVHCGIEMDGGHIGSVRCPYGVPGDRLYVRETIRCKGTWHDGIRDRCDAIYAADGTPVHRLTSWGWKRYVLPGIHCPYELSRILLEVTEVRAQRLRSISEADAFSEGVDPYECTSGPATPDAVAAFAELWDSINGKRAPWVDNPWVWVVSFKRLGGPGA